MSSQSSLLNSPPPQLLILSSSEEDNKDDEEDDEDEKDLDHQPAVGGDRLEVFEDLCVGGLHVQLGVLNVSVDPVREWNRKFSETWLLQQMQIVFVQNMTWK